MQRTDSTFDARESSALFRVTLAAEDAAAARRGMSLYYRLARRLASHVEFTQRSWSFFEFEDPLLRQVATLQASRSEMILLALRGDSPLPGAVQSWLDGLPVLKRFHSAALVVLLDARAEGPGSTALRERMRELASRCRMDLFIHSARSDDSSGVESRPAQRAVLPGLAVAERPHLRWGINE